jgi:hypothetical protein
LCFRAAAQISIGSLDFAGSDRIDNGAVPVEEVGQNPSGTGVIPYDPSRLNRSK